MNTSDRLHAFLAEFDKEKLPAIEQAAQAGDAEACFQLGALYANGRGVSADNEQAFHWLQQAAQSGVGAAQTLLAWFYANGQGVAADPRQARFWYSRAAAEGDADAQCALGDLHYGDGRPGDAKAMLQWYERAAQQGHPKAQYMLGHLLADGRLVEQNDEAAFQWLTLAVLHDSEPARKELQMLTARLGAVQLESFKQRMMQRMGRTH